MNYIYRFIQLVTAFVLTASVVFAADYRWDGGAGTADWYTANNWSPNTRPTSSDNAILDNTYVTTLPSALQISNTVGMLNLTINTDNSFAIQATANVAFTIGSGLTQSGSGTQTFDFSTGYVGLGSNSTWAINGTGGGVVVNAVIKDNTNTYSLTKSGSGRLVLNGANTFDGGVTVSGGALIVGNTTGSAVGTGNVSVNGGRIGGNGSIGASTDASNISMTDAGGVIAPGDGATTGVLTVYGNVNTTSIGNTSIEFTLNGAIVGSGYDQLKLSTVSDSLGNLTLGTSTALVLTLGFAPTVNETFMLVDVGGSGAISGTFAGLSEGSVLSATYGGNTYSMSISYLGGTGNDIVLTVVPEPNSLLLLSIGGLLLLVSRKSQKTVVL